MTLLIATLLATTVGVDSSPLLPEKKVKPKEELQIVEDLDLEVKESDEEIVFDVESDVESEE